VLFSTPVEYRRQTGLRPAIGIVTQVLAKRYHGQPAVDPSTRSEHRRYEMHRVQRRSRRRGTKAAVAPAWAWPTWRPQMASIRSGHGLNILAVARATPEAQAKTDTDATFDPH